ncbi:putative Serine/threonine-protein phosphatase [Blattamonas nauphoetae]|uniref:Serine/threonine-protein phosphatase n=1 Tax=Blattamonas nauphoetae TaxID=2049346 RepID=A0ABQ9WT33_9EUKA|nr:putative Serine/threonine-protein phosphatase [Blattamonas nauphoetae]
MFSSIETESVLDYNGPFPPENSEQLIDLTDCVLSGLTIVGDLHGNLESLTSVLLINGLPSDSNPYLFLGDYVDRGVNGVEVFALICAYKLKFPRSVFLLMGNHETEPMLHKRFGFYQELMTKYSLITDLSSNVDYNSADDLYQRFLRVFFSLPLAAVCYPSTTHLTAPSTPNPSPLSVRSSYFSSPRWSMADPTASPVSTPINLEAAAKNGYDPLAGRGVFFVHGGLPVVGTDGIPLQRLTLHDIERVDCYRILAQKHGYYAMWQAEESTLPSPSPRQSAMLVDSPQLTPEESARMKQRMEILAAKSHPRNQRSASLRTTRIMHQLLWNDPSANPTADLARPLPSPPVIPSQRGADTFIFDEEVSNTFLDRNGLKCVVRSHEAKLRGFEVLQKGRCWTNRGAMARLSFLPLSVLQDTTPQPQKTSSHSKKGSHRPSPVPQSTPSISPSPSSTLQKPLHAVPVFHFQEFDAGIPAPSPNTATPSSYVVHELGIAPPVPFPQDSTMGTDTGLTEAGVADAKFMPLHNSSTQIFCTLDQ